MRKIVLLMMVLIALMACQRKPLELPPEVVTDAIYNGKTCEEILADRERLQRLYEEEKAYRPDEGYSAWSIPKDFGLSIVKVFDKNIGENKNRKIRRYYRIKGEYESAERVAIRRCDYEAGDFDGQNTN